MRKKNPLCHWVCEFPLSEDKFINWSTQGHLFFTEQANSLEDEREGHRLLKQKLTDGRWRTQGNVR